MTPELDKRQHIEWEEDVSARSNGTHEIAVAKAIFRSQHFSSISPSEIPISLPVFGPLLDRMNWLGGLDANQFIQAFDEQKDQDFFNVNPEIREVLEEDQGMVSQPYLLTEEDEIDLKKITIKDPDEGTKIIHYVELQQPED